MKIQRESGHCVCVFIYISVRLKRCLGCLQACWADLCVCVLACPLSVFTSVSWFPISACVDVRSLQSRGEQRLLSVIRLHQWVCSHSPLSPACLPLPLFSLPLSSWFKESLQLCVIQASSCGTATHQLSSSTLLLFSSFLLHHLLTGGAARLVHTHTQTTPQEAEGHVTTSARCLKSNPEHASSPASIPLLLLLLLHNTTHTSESATHGHQSRQKRVLISRTN